MPLAAPAGTVSITGMLTACPGSSVMVLSAILIHDVPPRGSTPEDQRLPRGSRVYPARITHGIAVTRAGDACIADEMHRHKQSYQRLLLVLVRYLSGVALISVKSRSD